ncbi:MAG: sulfatase-like hydrolase/transferase, partial [Schwartzia sp.]|nr:sulfatase-like hydrolase/transferase [Schwartzia sp. (in: firmicutes)]
MDWNAYVLIYSAILVSLPGAFFPQWFAVGDSLRVFGVCFYIAILYAAFLGKLVYYYHYRDIYNKTLWMGKNADKKNLLDIFFNQNHGALLLLSFIPFLFLCVHSVQLLLSTPTFSYPTFSSNIYRYLFNTFTIIIVVALFYYCRYGGSFNHANKPEWDEIPTVVKEDIFLAKATIDDLVALELVWKYPPHELLNHSDEESAPLIDTVIPKEDWRHLAQPLAAFARTAQGPRITPPKHIFYLLAESYEQAPLDSPYADLHIADAGKAFCADTHTFTIPNFLSAGLLSQPSLVSLLLGIYDAGLELNEREDFWHNTLPTTLPLQMHALGYRTAFWYGGELNWGSLQHFLPAVGFDEMHGAPDFCPSNAPRTWLGVYDHIFLT